LRYYLIIGSSEGSTLAVLKNCTCHYTINPAINLLLIVLYDALTNKF